MSIVGKVIYTLMLFSIGLPVAMIGACLLLFDPKESVSTLINWWKTIKDIWQN